MCSNTRGVELKKVDEVDMLGLSQRQAECSDKSQRIKDFEKNEDSKVADGAKQDVRPCHQEEESANLRQVRACHRRLIVDANQV